MDACKHRMTLFTIRRRDAFLFGADAASREKFKAKGKSRDSGADRQRIQQGVRAFANAMQEEPGAVQEEKLHTFNKCRQSGCYLGENVWYEIIFCNENMKIACGILF